MDSIINYRHTSCPWDGFIEGGVPVFKCSKHCIIPFTILQQPLYEVVLEKLRGHLVIPDHGVIVFSPDSWIKN